MARCLARAMSSSNWRFADDIVFERVNPRMAGTARAESKAMMAITTINSSTVMAEHDCERERMRSNRTLRPPVVIGLLFILLPPEDIVLVRTLLRPHPNIRLSIGAERPDHDCPSQHIRPGVGRQWRHARQANCVAAG